jgi:hypothetical protein
MKQLFLYILILFTSAAFAQSDIDKEHSYKLSTGFSASSLTGSVGKNFNKPGIWGEFQYSKRLNPLFSWSLGVRFIQKGALKPPDPENGDTRLYILTMNYVHVPFYYTFRKNGIDYFAGIATGYLISTKEEDENGPIFSSNGFRRLEVAGNIGARFQLFTKMQLITQFEHSLHYTRPYVGGSFRLNRGHYNSSLILGVSYQF